MCEPDWCMDLANLNCLKILANHLLYKLLKYYLEKDGINKTLLNLTFFATFSTVYRQKSGIMTSSALVPLFLDEIVKYQSTNKSSRVTMLGIISEY